MLRPLIGLLLAISLFTGFVPAEAAKKTKIEKTCKTNFGGASTYMSSLKENKTLSEEYVTFPSPQAEISFRSGDVPIVRFEPLEQEVQRIVGRLINSNPDILMQRLPDIHLIDVPETNFYVSRDGAIILPLGFFETFSRSEFAESEDVFAYALAHELAHNLLNHLSNKTIYEGSSQQRSYIAETIPIVSSAVSSLVKRNAGKRTAKLSRCYEVSADTLAADLVVNAGYNNQAPIAFFNHLQDLKESHAPKHEAEGKKKKKKRKRKTKRGKGHNYFSTAERARHMRTYVDKHNIEPDTESVEAFWRTGEIKQFLTTRVQLFRLLRRLPTLEKEEALAKLKEMRTLTIVRSPQVSFVEAALAHLADIPLPIIDSVKEEELRQYPSLLEFQVLHYLGKDQPETAFSFLKKYHGRFVHPYSVAAHEQRLGLLISNKMSDSSSADLFQNRCHIFAGKNYHLVRNLPGVTTQRMVGSSGGGIITSGASARFRRSKACNVVAYLCTSKLVADYWPEQKASLKPKTCANLSKKTKLSRWPSS